MTCTWRRSRAPSGRCSLPRSPRCARATQTSTCARPSSNRTPRCRAILDEACRAAGFVPDVPFHANDFGVLAAFVASGLGAAMVPALALGAFGGDIVVRPVADVPVRRRIYVATRRGGLARPALRAMLDALRSAR